MDGNKTFATNRAGEITRYTYDKNGNVLTMTNKLGGIFRYTYDNMGNLLTITYSDFTMEMIGIVKRWVMDKKYGLK